MTKDIEKPTLAEKQAFWNEQLPLFKEAYWLPEHFELLKFDMEAGNFVVRDDIDPAFEDDADDLYHRVNTGWSMWKRAVNLMQKKLEGCVVVPVEPTKAMIDAMEQFDCRYDYADLQAAYKAALGAARGGNE